MVNSWCLRAIEGGKYEVVSTIKEWEENGREGMGWDVKGWGAKACNEMRMGVKGMGRKLRCEYDNLAGVAGEG